MLSGCVKNDILTITKSPFLEDNLKTNGYYYNFWHVDSSSMVEINFLYKDGVLLHCGNNDSSDTYHREVEYQNGTFYKRIKDNKLYWGVYKVEEDSIFIERWYPFRPFGAYRQSGVILNDSTYHLTRIIRVDGTEESQIDEVFHFKHFSPKPDSTNSFVN
jgi:hypothetical protein